MAPTQSEILAEVEAIERAQCALLRWAADQNLPFAEYAVLVMLARSADKTGRAQISKAEIGRRAGVTERQVHTHLLKLVEKKLVSVGRGERRGRGRPANAYTLNSGTAVPEADFMKSTSGNHVPEVNFQKSDFEKSTSRTPLQERALAVIAAVDNSQGAYIGTGACAETPNTKTTEPRSDLIVSKAMIDALAERAGDACDRTAAGLAHGAHLNRLLREGCDWEQDILPAVDKLAASFIGRGKKFKTWELLQEHALEFRNLRVAGLPPPAPPVRRDPPRNGVRRNLYLEACNAA